MSDASTRMNRAVFFDRDGTLNEEKHYLHKPEDVVLFSGVDSALNRLKKAGFKLIVISNQSGVGRGYFTMKDVQNVNNRLNELLASENAQIERFYIAPEAPGQPSRGRKPSPQFLLDARDEFSLDLSQCYMIGDKLIDLECGWNAGVKKSILVCTGYGVETEKKHAAELKNAWIAQTLGAAADLILSSK